MIFDCFIMSEELDLLEIRLRVLDAAVDWFVLCEAPFTFRGKPKRLAFAESSSRFEPWRAKIIPLVYPGPPDPDPWHNEWNQRDYLARALFERARPEDLVLLSDCDEIPAPENVARRPTQKRLVGHHQRLCHGYVNSVAEAPWLGTRALHWRDFEAYKTFNNVRKRPKEEVEIVTGGWHFSGFGGAKAALAKMQSYSHSEFDIPYLTDAKRLELVYASTPGGEFVELDDSFPAFFRDEARWSRYIWHGPKFDIAVSGALAHAYGCFAYVPDDASSIAVIAQDNVDAWEAAGIERFGDRFLGVTPNAPGLGERLRGAGWIVIDKLERLQESALMELIATGAGLVGYFTNASSYYRLDRVLRGEPFPPGPAVGIRRLRSVLKRGVRQPDRADRVQTAGIFVPWSKTPESLYKVVLGSNLRFARISRDELADFLAKALILIWQSRPQTI